MKKQRLPGPRVPSVDPIDWSDCPLALRFPRVESIEPGAADRKRAEQSERVKAYKAAQRARAA